MMRLSDRELFLLLFRRGYSIEALGELRASLTGDLTHDACDEVEDMIRDAINEAARHKKRGRR